MDGSLMGVGSHDPIVGGLEHLNVLLKSFVCSNGIVRSDLQKYVVADINVRGNEDNYIIDE
jgi:hypothetical protein